MGILCPICLQDVRLPVNLCCFPCRAPVGRRGCDDQVICLYCARDFLGLNVMPRLRPDSIRCLFCHATTNPRYLNANNSYRKNYGLRDALDADLRRLNTSVKCQRCDMECDSHEKLDEHLYFECGGSMRVCRFGCEYAGSKDSIADHNDMCPHQTTTCSLCSRRITLANYHKHVRAECTMRLKVCLYCSREVRAMDMRHHLQSHITEVKIMMRHLRT